MAALLHAGRLLDAHRPASTLVRLSLRVVLDGARGAPGRRSIDRSGRCTVIQGRLYYYAAEVDQVVDADHDYSFEALARQPCEESQANLVGSRCDPDDPRWHMPVFDVDRCDADVAVSHLAYEWSVARSRFRCWSMPDLELRHVHVVPSSTPGHFHVYVDQVLEWWCYRDLLRQLVACGVVEEGYLRAALDRGATFVRKPGVRKPEEVSRG